MSLRHIPTPVPQHDRTQKASEPKKRKEILVYRTPTNLKEIEGKKRTIRTSEVMPADGVEPSYSMVGLNSTDPGKGGGVVLCGVEFGNF